MRVYSHIPKKFRMVYFLFPFSFNLIVLSLVASPTMNLPLPFAPIIQSLPAFYNLQLSIYNFTLSPVFYRLARIGGRMRMGNQKARRNPACRRRAAVQKISPKFLNFQVKISPAASNILEFFSLLRTKCDSTILLFSKIP